jgi:hypothetical protein
MQDTNFSIFFIGRLSTKKVYQKKLKKVKVVIIRRCQAVNLNNVRYNIHFLKTKLTLRTHCNMHQYAVIINAI